MADKRIDQLPVATQINDADLFVIEQSNTAKSVSGQKIKALVPTSLSQLSQDSTHRLVTDAEKTAWNGKASNPKTASVTLDTTWTASGDNYTKTVTISGVTANSKVDVQPDAAVIAQLVNDGVTALYFTNNSGTVSAVAVGAMPTASMTVQVTITEVTA